MSVFDDPKKELEALQAQLEAQEDWFQRELDSAKRMIGEKPTAAVAAAPTRKYPQTLRPQAVRKPVFSEIPEIPEIAEEEPKKKKGIRGLVLVAGLELLGILGIAGYWLLVLLK